MAGESPLFVVDVSSIVRAALTDDSAAAELIATLLERGLIVSSPAILDELDDVLRRPKFRRWRSEASMRAFTTRVRASVRLIVPELAVQDCRDPSDDKYLEVAWAVLAQSEARVSVTIVSDDQDLLVLDPWRDRIRILKPEAAQAFIRESGGQ
ncbi:MAG TPA: putative toxin-antitoxin system toxin component, PIN family [Acetobacteraceae bacterium]|nr:putative toxin-antitoxin system toxin component, PIN family [Acetobacteraceae bacterium]